MTSPFDLSHALSFALAQTWAMEEAAHRRMMQILSRHASGIRLSDEDLTAATGKDMPERRAEMRIENGVAVIPIHGVIAHRAGAVGRISSRVGTSVDHIRRDLEDAVANDSVRSILLDVDSPGGSVSGLDQLAADIRAARARKPIVAHTDSLMASAAYWLSSQADQVLATRDAVVGSIGVITSFYDVHRFLQNEGVDPVVIKSTPRKGGVQQNASVSDSDRAEVQREVDVYHEMFVDNVAAGRGLERDAASAMADGRVYIGKEAVDRGYLDGLVTQAAAMKVARSLGRERAAAAVILPNTGNGAGSGAETDGEQPEDPMSKKTDPAPAQPSAQTTAAQPQPTTPAPESSSTATAEPVRQEDPVATAVARERNRCATILRGASDAQREMALAFIDGGTETTEALVALNSDLHSRLRAQTSLVVAPHLQAIGSGNASGTQAASTGDADDEDQDQEAKWRAAWKSDAKLRAEFINDEDRYLAFMRSEARAAANR
ncbi:MAG: S49 family peptidase [Planctomycetes bacterium]|nr:S49 family peptidase [Planctomycetota bacterium]